MTKKVPLKIYPSLVCTREEVAAMLTGALEGGSNDWYRIVGKKPPKKWTYMSWNNKIIDPPMTHEAMLQSPLKNDIFWQYDYPLNEGGSITVVDANDDDSEKVEVDSRRLFNACTIMRNKYPKVFKRMKTDLGSCDALCADLFFQIAVWNEKLF